MADIFGIRNVLEIILSCAEHYLGSHVLKIRSSTWLKIRAPAKCGYVK